LKVEGSELRSNSHGAPRSRERKKTNPKATKVLITHLNNLDLMYENKTDTIIVKHTLHRHTNLGIRERNASQPLACSLDFVYFAMNVGCEEH